MNSFRTDPQPDGLNRHAPVLTVLLSLLVVLAAAGTALAQGNSNGTDKIPPPPVELTNESISERMNALDEQGSLDEATRKEIKTTYQKALQELSTLESLQNRISEYKSVQKNGSSEIEKFQRQQEEISGRPELSVPEQAPVDQLLKEIQKSETYIPAEPELSFLQQELNDRQSQLSDTQSSLEEVKTKLSEIKSRRENIQTLLNEAQQELDDVTSELSSLSMSDSPGERAIAELTLLHVRKKKLETRLKALELEKQTYETRRDLLQARQNFLSTRSNRQEKLVQLLQMVVSQNMERRAKEELEETQETLKQASEFPVLEDMARRVKELAEERASDNGPILGTQRITERLKGTQSIRQSISADLKNVKDRIQAAGLTHQLGTLLRRKKEELPSVSDHQSDIDDLEQKMSEAQLRLIELNEDKSNLIQEKDQIITDRIKQMDPDVSDQKKEELKARMNDLLNRRLGVIEKLIEEYDRYFTKITDLIAQKRKLVSVLKDYRTYIDERVIWIRSTSNYFQLRQSEEPDPSEQAESPCTMPPGVDATVRHVPQAFHCLMQPEHWKQTVNTLTSDLKDSYPLYIAALLLLSLLFWYRSSFYDRLTESGKGTFSRHGDSFFKTFNALLYTVLITVPLPGILLFLGWRLSMGASVSANFVSALGVALTGTGMYYFVISGLVHTCHPEGLGRNHFRWSEENIRQVRTNILYLLYPALLTVFLFVLTNHIENRFYRDALGRLFFVITMGIIAWFTRRVLSPHSGIVYDYLDDYRGGWLDRMRYVWYPLIVAIPLALAGLALFGYYYTARQLTYRLSLSFVAFLGLLYLVEIFVRWQIINNIDYAVQKREKELEKEREERGETRDETNETRDMEKEGSFSLPTVNEQTQQLLWSFFWIGLIVSLWLIWSDVLPALGMLDEVKLWSHPEQALETVTGEEGQSIQRSVERQVPVTLADVLLGLLIIVMTVVISKNLPGLLEITLLHYLPMDQGLRYAYKTISRYIIVLLGILGSAAMFGIRWGDIQWLVAGVSVGLGFGLQEIFANFVSGIILLFERPIRVGDTVTVNDVTGRVTRIRTRATTIQDLDRKELVVPNRDFIQGELVNWTLSDSIMRVVIPIGVAYGSDTDLVEEKLMEITRQQDIVLDDPQPNVIFTGFGDNALQFSLRFFIESYDNYWIAFHRVNRAVDKTFKEAGITIAFPQRDLHLKSVDDDVSVSFSADDIPDDPEASPEPPDQDGEEPPEQEEES